MRERRGPRPTPTAARLRRLAVSLAVLALVPTTVAGCGSAGPAGSSPSPGSGSASASTGATSPTARNTPAPTRQPSTTTKPEAAAELPRGGRQVFPRYRLVGYAGLTGFETLGRLGTGPLDQRVREMESRAEPYAADGRQVLPVLEVMTSVVQGSPGKDKKYRNRISDDEIATYLKAARKHEALLLLAIQPGRADFLDEVKHYEKWLSEPDVGVALDPEWAMGKHQVPGRVFGHTTGSKLNSVSSYLSGLVRRHDLPEKVMVFHELAPQIVTGENALKDHPGVAVVKSVDGIGSRAAKTNTYRVVNRDTPKFVQAGFKLFYTEDKKVGKKLMTSQQVMALKPRPSYVLYE